MQPHTIVALALVLHHNLVLTSDRAEATPVGMWDPNQIGFVTVQEAALAALKNITTNEKSKDFEQFEYGGNVFVRNQKYYYTLPQTSHESHTFRINVGFPTDGRIVAIYHNHPRVTVLNPNNNTQVDLTNVFSPSDIKAAEDGKIPSYILVTSKNEIRVYDPSIDKHTTLNIYKPIMPKPVADGRVL